MSGVESSSDIRGSAAEDIRRGLIRFAGPALFVVELALVVVFAVLLARFAWLIIAPGGAVSGLQQVQGTGAASEEVRTALTGDMSLLVAANPFVRTVGSAADIPDVPETKLNLTLKGVRASADGTGVAMIVLPDNRLHIFAPGEAILEGVVLDRVYGDRVTLRKSGQVESLLMGSGANRLAVLSDPDNPQRPASATGPAANAAEPVISSTATDFLANLVINPVHHGQEFMGYEIGSRGDAALLESSGLKAGDIVLAVDGISVGASAPGELAMRLASSRSVRLRIDRDGRQIDQTFTLPEKP